MAQNIFLLHDAYFDFQAKVADIYFFFIKGKGASIELSWIGIGLLSVQVDKVSNKKWTSFHKGRLARIFGEPCSI